MPVFVFFPNSGIFLQFPLIWKLNAYFGFVQKRKSP
ncbi:hypothetical protein P872_05765 [Rhodonellum psychrophilum GCM71 = DSM 17998]|uniref:Uncharacterized protein n=1 Tax=Rhodonellum psychrophilum GCM71 = DSM 17998 TaxID=1123057 RepID=U5C0T3_9BACT|nr:hypothetical protein P872_05765 [Rhodonellum psychrophilum GCM71 = DSM 17998]